MSKATRVQRFQCLQFFKQPVVLRIRNRRFVEYVVTVGVGVQLFVKLSNAFCRVCGLARRCLAEKILGHNDKQG